MNNILFNIYMAIVFIIPGFIIICITERIIPKEKTEYNLKILDFFIYSFINMLFCGILLFNIILNFNWWINNYKTIDIYKQMFYNNENYIRS